MTGLTAEIKPSRFNFNWIPDFLFRPRRAFQRLASVSSATWITPLIILSILAIANVFVSGRIKYQAAMTGEITYPPDYQYYTPEQQAQYTQAIQSTQGPVFIYVIPGITKLLGVWVSWLLLGGLLHLIITLLGGRGNTSLSLNIVAWASLPFAFRLLVQTIFMLITKQSISSPGLSGFSPQGDTGVLLFLAQFLKLIDIYIIWMSLLLILGVHISTALSTGKSVIGVVLSVAIIIMLQAGLAYGISLIGSLSISRPFFF